jgi:hypothetical protein
MKKLISFIILLSVMCCSTAARSQSKDEIDTGFFVILDVLFYRPVGLAVTLIGTGVFIGMSPLTALASIPAPHDAFAKTSNILILAPAAYTFIRPVGDRTFPYHVPQNKHKPVAAQKNIEPYKPAVIPKQRSVAPAVPDMQSPQRYRDTGGGL